MHRRFSSYRWSKTGCSSSSSLPIWAQGARPERVTINYPLTSRHTWGSRNPEHRASSAPSAEGLTLTRATRDSHAVNAKQRRSPLIKKHSVHQEDNTASYCVSYGWAHWLQFSPTEGPALTRQSRKTAAHCSPTDAALWAVHGGTAARSQPHLVPALSIPTCPLSHFRTQPYFLKHN